MKLLPGNVRAVLVVSMLFGTASAVSGQEAVFLVRHAERLNDSTDSPLSAEGRARAGRLAQMLRSAGISAIFVSQFQRTAETAQPLATLTNLRLERTATAQVDALVAKIRALGAKERALVVSHADRLPALLKALGINEEVTLPASQYDDLFLVVHGEGKQPALVRLKY